MSDFFVTFSYVHLTNFCKLGLRRPAERIKDQFWPECGPWWWATADERGSGWLHWAAVAWPEHAGLLSTIAHRLAVAGTRSSAGSPDRNIDAVLPPDHAHNDHTNAIRNYTQTIRQCMQTVHPTVVCHLVVVVGLMHRWPGRFLIWRRGANYEQAAW